MKKVNFNLEKVKAFVSEFVVKAKAKLQQRSNAKTSTHSNSFDWNQILNFFIQLGTPSKRDIIHRSFIITTCLTLSYYSAKGISTLLNPKSTTKKRAQLVSPPPAPLKLSSSTISTIKERNLFHSDLKDKEYKNLARKKPIDLNKECTKADRPSSLGIKLLTTTVLQDSVKSIASVQVRSNKPVEVREGDKIGQMAKVSKIERLYLVLKNLQNGECEYVERKEDKIKTKIKVLNPQLGKKVMAQFNNPGIKNVGNHFTIKKSVKEQMLNNLSKVLTQAKAIPMRAPDGNMYFKITEIVPGSIFSQLNIQNDDIITKINGKPIQNLNTVMNMFGSFRDISNLSLSIKRDGEEVDLDYQFE